jgi:hypothetical protein
MTYHLVSAVTLIGAAGFYMAGFAGAGVAFLAFGIALEMAFWMRAVRARRRRVT